MTKDEIFKKLFLIVQWDYVEIPDFDDPLYVVYPFEGKDVKKYVDKLLKEARKYLNEK